MRTKLAPKLVTKKQVAATCQLLRQYQVVCVYCSYSFNLFGLAKVAYLIMECFLELWLNMDR